MKFPIKIVSILTVALMLLTAIPMTVTDNAAADTATAGSDEIPSKFRIDDNYIEPVRSQHPEGICWAFAMCSVLETELLQQGADYASTVLSPVYESYSMYDSKEYSGSGDCLVLLNGTFGRVGSFSFPDAMMIANGRGPMYEYIAPFSEISYYALDKTIASSNILTVREIKVLDPYTQIDEIKELIYDGHAGQINYAATDMKDEYLKRTESSTTNHAATVVGWDDSYPKEKFTRYGVTPPGDGAWIVKNSYGEATGYDGYSYVSYYSVIERMTFLTDVTINDGTLSMYSYDNGYSVRSDRAYRDCVIMANVFTCENDGYIDSASFSTYLKTDLHEDYTFTVYKLNRNYDSPTDGKVIAKGDTCSTDGCCGMFNCYFTPTEKLHKGDKFSVCVELKGDMLYVPIDTYESYYNNHVSYTVANKGESFIKYNGDWTDVSADGVSNVRIKAYLSTGDSDEATLNDVRYDKFTDALREAENGDTISLLKNVSCDAFTIDKDLTIRFRGYDLTVKTASDDQAAVTVDRCNVTLEYGRINTKSTRTIETVGGSLSAKYIEFNSPENIINSSGTKISLTSITYNNDDGSMTFTRGSAVLKNCHILNEMDDTEKGVLTSINCKVTIESGNYNNLNFVQNATGDILIKSGTFFTKIDKDLVDSESSLSYYKKTNKSTVVTREITVEGHPEIKRLSDLGEAGDGAVGVLQKDLTNTAIMFFSSDNLVVDLNGHDFINDNVIDVNEGTKYNIINSSDKRSTVYAKNLVASLSKNIEITIGDNIDIICTDSIAIDNLEKLKINISDKSVIKIVREKTDCKEIYYPYFNSSGKYCEKIEISLYGDAKTVKMTYSGVTEDTTRGKADLKYTATGTYSDANGKVLGTWKRVYNIDHAQAFVITHAPYIDIMTDASGKVFFEYHDNITGQSVTVPCETNAVYDGTNQCVITSVVAGEVTEKTAAKLIDTAVGYNKEAEKAINDYVKNVNYRKCISILSDNNIDKILDKDKFNDLLDKGYDVGVTANGYSYALKSGTGKLTGDTVIHVEKTGKSDLSDKQSDAIGSGVAYNIYATVDGKVTDKLPCECVVTLSQYRVDSAKVSVVSNDGTSKDIDTKISADGNSFYFTLSESCVIAVNAEPAEDETVAHNTMIIVIAVIVIISLGLIFVTRKH